jgi:hypothetical protein
VLTDYDAQNDEEGVFENGTTPIATNYITKQDLSPLNGKALDEKT